jgi:hypothetical protein
MARIDAQSYVTQCIVGVAHREPFQFFCRLVIFSGRARQFHDRAGSFNSGCKRAVTGAALSQILAHILLLSENAW